VGADGITLVNTLPGVLLKGDGVPELGAGPGGMSGPALRPAGLLAVRRARPVTHLPLVGVGGVTHALDAVAYARAGASLVQVGTANFADPRAGARIVRDLARWGARGGQGGRGGVQAWCDLVAPAPPDGGVAAVRDPSGRPMSERA
jgi:dihydroorotate dehydrogenase (NAD+) catalytic subunit